MIISVILAYAFKWLGLVDDVLLMIIIISTISLGVVVPTLKRNEYNAHNYRSIYIISSRIGLVTMVLLTIYGGINGSGNGSVWLSTFYLYLLIFYI